MVQIKHYNPLLIKTRKSLTPESTLSIVYKQEDTPP